MEDILSSYPAERCISVEQCHRWENNKTKNTKQETQKENLEASDNNKTDDKQAYKSWGKIWSEN